MKITLSRKELSAALLFASTDETRFTLMGIQVETRGNQPTLTATDGRRLVVIESSSDQDSEYTPGDAGFILRADFVKPLCALSKSIGGELLPWLMFDMSPGSKRVQVKIVGRECYLDTHDGALTEGSYPNWRQIIPAKDVERAPIREIAINSEYVGDFAKAAKLLGSESAIASFNLAGKDAQGSYGAIEVRLESLPQFYGLVMPCKFSEGEDYQPEFLAIKEAFPQAPKGENNGKDHSSLA